MASRGRNKNVVMICRIVVITFTNLLSDLYLVNNFNASAASSRAGLKEFQEIVNLKISNHPMLKNQTSTCDKCQCERFF